MPVNIAQGSFSFGDLQARRFDRSDAQLIFRYGLTAFGYLLVHADIVDIETLRIRDGRIVSPCPAVLRFPVVIERDNLDQRISDRRLMRHHLYAVHIYSYTFRCPVKAIYMKLFRQFLIGKPGMFRVILDRRVFPAMHGRPDTVDISPQYFEDVDLATLVRIIFKPDQPPGTMHTAPSLHLGTHFVVAVLVYLRSFRFNRVKGFPFRIIVVHTGTAGTHKTRYIHTLIKLIF